VHWLTSYAALTALFVITPGASTALVLRNSIAGGRRSGLETASGIALGNSTYAAASGLGLSSLLLAAPQALASIRLVGACYLGWLGLAGLIHAAQGQTLGVTELPHQRPAGEKHRRPFVEGLTTNLLNPAIPLFYATYVPQFVAPETPFWPRFGTLAVVHVLMALSTHSFYAVTIGSAAGALVRPRARRRIDVVTSLMLIGLAAQMAWR
jgi:threonine/homoserine/homoserine lactone efflux protein